MKMVSGYVLPTVLIITLLIGLSVTAVFENISSRYRLINSSINRVDEVVERMSCVELARIFLENIMTTQPLSAYLRSNTYLPANFAPVGYSCPNIRLVPLSHTGAASNTSTASLSSNYGKGNARTQRYVQIRVEDDMQRPGFNTNIAVSMGYAE